MFKGCTITTVKWISVALHTRSTRGGSGETLSNKHTQQKELNVRQYLLCKLRSLSATSKTNGWKIYWSLPSSSVWHNMRHDISNSFTLHGVCVCVGPADILTLHNTVSWLYNWLIPLWLHKISLIYKTYVVFCYDIHKMWNKKGKSKEI